MFFFLGELEEELSCEAALDEFKIDEKKLPSVEETEQVDLGRFLLLLTFFLVGRPRSPFLTCLTWFSFQLTVFFRVQLQEVAC